MARPKGIDIAQKNEMIAMYKAGATLRDIANVFDLCPTTVKYHLRHVTTQFQKGGKEASKIPYAEIAPKPDKVLHVGNEHREPDACLVVTGRTVSLKGMFEYVLCAEKDELTIGAGGSESIMVVKAGEVAVFANELNAIARKLDAQKTGNEMW